MAVLHTRVPVVNCHEFKLIMPKFPFNKFSRTCRFYFNNDRALLRSKNLLRVDGTYFFIITYSFCVKARDRCGGQS